MAQIRGKDTKPEKQLRSALHALGVRFRGHDKSLPGRPDISHKGAKVAIFVDGCFWHGCPEHFKAPKSNVEYWTKKRAYLDDLRARKKGELEGMGFLVIEVWEHEIRENLHAVASRIAGLVLNRRGLRA